MDDGLVEHERELRRILAGQQIPALRTKVDKRGHALIRRFLIIENLQNGRRILLDLEDSGNEHCLELTYGRCRRFVVDQLEERRRCEFRVWPPPRSSLGGLRQVDQFRYLIFIRDAVERK